MTAVRSVLHPREPPSTAPHWLARCLRLSLIAVFVSLAARHWDPHYGFTRFLQADPNVAAKAVSWLRELPIYVYPDRGSYDGFFYAQIATDPTLRAPELRSAIDDLGYRARRILLPALAWVAGRGDPLAVVRSYAWLNVVGWLALAALLWRVFPTGEWRGTAAWTGVLFATGTLVNVRFALPDLAALGLTALALRAAERSRHGRAAGWLALAGLARETALLGAVIFLPRAGDAPSARRTRFAAALFAVLPLAVWLLHIRHVVGSSSAGLRNFNWPGVGLATKLSGVAAACCVESNHWLVVSSLLCLVALATQFTYLALRRTRDDPWWRTGAGYAGLLLFLGPAVWGDDLPGAAVRVLLPLGLTFNVLAVRHRAGPAWLIAGNLWVVGAWPVLANVPPDLRSLATGALRTGTYVTRTLEGWHQVESRGRHRWVWTACGGELAVETWPRTTRTLQVSLALSPFTPGDVEIRSGDRLLQVVELHSRHQPVTLPPLPAPAGELTIRLTRSAPARPENAATGARLLGFAVSDLRVTEPER